MSKLLVGSATDVGLVRSNNQDKLLVADGLYAVADGMGGHAAGEVASATAVKALEAAFEASDHHSAEALLNAVVAANRAVWEQAQSHRGMQGMGTTLVTLAVVERQDSTRALAIAHIGDSRAYMYRQGELTQLTVDHSFVQELVADGQISQAQAAVHPQRHVLTRALGVEPVVEVDLIPVEPRHGDRYLLCSDGLPREVTDDEIASVLQSVEDPGSAASMLVGLAIAHGGSDNVSVVVIDVLANGTGSGAISLPVPAAQATLPNVPVEPAQRPEPGTAIAFVKGQARNRPYGREVAHRSLAGKRPSSNPRRAQQTVFTWRLATFLAAICIVVAACIGTLAWYARSAYFVTISRGKITIFQGRPGGVRWFGPTLAERTSYGASSVLPYRLVQLHSGQMEPSLVRARQFVANLVAEKVEAENAVPAYARGAPRTATTASTPAKPARRTQGSTAVAERTANKASRATTTKTTTTTQATSTAR
jgi:protein phosphatase